MNSPFEVQLNKGTKEVFYYTLYDACTCEVLPCTKDEIPLVIEKNIFVRMDYSIPVFRTPERSLESII